MARRLAALLAILPSVVGGQSMPTVSLGDAIAMTHIQRTYDRDERIVVFSPDGHIAAAVVWRGDLSRDRNVYSILAFDVRTRIAPTTVLSVDFDGDSTDQDATPVSQLLIMPDDRTITFLGALHGTASQVYAVDRLTHQVKALTRHRSAVRSYGVGSDGQVRIFSAVADADSATTRRRNRAGYSPAGQGTELGLSALLGSESAPQTRQYFVQSGGPERLVFDSRTNLRDPVAESSPRRGNAAVPLGTPVDDDTPKSLSVDPTGRYALLWPYTTLAAPAHPERYRFFDGRNAYENRMAAFYALVDLATGRLTRLIDAPHDPFVRNSGVPIWSPDGRTVIVSSLLPLAASDTAAAAATAGQPELVAVELRSGRVSSLHIEGDWKAVGWVHRSESDTVILQHGQSIAAVGRGVSGWGPLAVRGAAVGFNTRYPISTNGRLIVGVSDSLTSPPEIALYDLASHETRVVTDLNPRLRQRRYGHIEKIHWRGSFDSASFGYLVTPPDYHAGQRYPLLVLLKDAGADDSDNSFLLDGQGQLSGYAIQTLAADGLVVLFAPDPPSMRQVIERPEEGEHEIANVEGGIAYLNERGLIDTTCIGLAGFSREAYEMSYILGHGRRGFMAAAQIDGGGLFDYNTGDYVPVERYRAPLLLEVHNPQSMADLWPYIERFGVLRKPIDVYYYPGASHDARQPMTRWYSLSRTEQWFRYWLQGWRDPDPAKRDQYAKWDAMRVDGLARPQ
jgi:dipeptidyl aminopeptidase/acylaminoacyl peptidase